MCRIVVSGITFGIIILSCVASNVEIVLSDTQGLTEGACVLGKGRAKGER